MISKSLTDGFKSAKVCGEKRRPSERSLPDCLTTRNFNLSNVCGNNRTTPSVVENTNNHDKGIAMELPAEVLSFAETGRATRKGKIQPAMRVEGNSLCAPQTNDLSKEGWSDSDEIDCDDHSGNDRRHTSCQLVTRLFTSLHPLKTRSLSSTPFHEMTSGKGVNGGLPGCLLAQSVDSVSTGRHVAATSMNTEGTVRKVRDKPRRIPPIPQPARKHLLMPLEHHETARFMSIEGTQFSTNTLEKDQENSIDLNLQGNQERCESNKELTNGFLSPVRPAEIENVTTGKLPEQRKMLSEPELKFSLPSISVSQPSDRYKSRFRVKLLPLVTKSDSLPNLTESFCSQSSGLLVTSSLGHSTPALHLKGISETTEQAEEMKQRETDAPPKTRTRARSLSVDSAFSVSNLMFASRREAGEIAIDGNKLLPEIKAGPVAKKPSLPSLKGAKKVEKVWFPPGNNLPWR